MKSSILIPTIKQGRLLSKEKQPSQQKSIQDNRQSFIIQQKNINTIQLSRIGPITPPTLDRENPNNYDDDNFAFTSANYTQAQSVVVDPGILPSNYVPGNSRVLAAALMQGGAQRPYAESQTHHIVEARDEGAQTSRDILDSAGIEIDSPINGAFLPNNSADDINSTIHRGQHDSSYSEEVEQRLIQTLLEHNIHSLYEFNTLTGGEGIMTQDAIGATLNEIRDLLLDGSIELNANRDPDYRE